MSTEAEDLTNLVKHPGWLRVQQAAKADWDAQLGSHVTAAANERDDAMALNKLRQILAAKTAVERLLLWPEDRLRKLLQPQHANEPTLSRRGGL